MSKFITFTQNYILNESYTELLPMPANSGPRKLIINLDQVRQIQFKRLQYWDAILVWIGDAEYPLVYSVDEYAPMKEAWDALISITQCIEFK